MLKVLIADVNIAFCSAAMEHLKAEGDIEPYYVQDGLTALNTIKEIKPDLLLLDLILPHIDGLGVLEKIKDYSERPKVILMSTVSQEDIFNRAMDLGADYYLLKPINLDILCSRIRQFAGQGDRLLEITTTTYDSIVTAKVTEMLINLGVPAHLLGYQYLREAIMITVVNNQIIYSVTKGLYPAIAKRFKTSVPKVERAIRHAISLAYTRGNPILINKLFGQNVRLYKPSNSRFIATIADKVRLNLDVQDLHEKVKSFA